MKLPFGSTSQASCMVLPYPPSMMEEHLLTGAGARQTEFVCRAAQPTPIKQMQSGVKPGNRYGPAPPSSRQDLIVKKWVGYTM